MVFCSIWFTILLCVPSVLWHCWLGHLTCKNPFPIWPIMCLVFKPYSINQPPLSTPIRGVLRNVNVKGPGSSNSDHRKSNNVKSRVQLNNNRTSSVVLATLRRGAVDWWWPASQSKRLEKSSLQRRRSWRKLCSALIIWTRQWLRMTLESFRAGFRGGPMGPRPPTKRGLPSNPSIFISRSL